LRDYDDVAFATKTFESLWLEAVDILPAQLGDLKEKTYLNDRYTPFEVYLKFLMEYFGTAIEYDPESITDLPKGYKKLAYQIDAVNDGYNKLMKHNGFILADVVGLGKTIVASIIAKKFYFANGYRTRILVVHPPALESTWVRTIKDDFEVPNVDFITNGSLHNVKRPENYDLIIVDEAHKFRSDEARMFNELQKLCKTPCKRPAPDGSLAKKVILITATPLNNRPEDIRNQLYLFQDSKRSTLEVGNLQQFFRPHIDNYRLLKKEQNSAIIARELKKMYADIRVKVLEPVIVRRTRTDIKDTPEYAADMKDQGMKFPDIVPPHKILYQLDEQLDALYDKTLLMARDTVNGLGYYRYQAIRYMNAEARTAHERATGVKQKQAERISEQLAKIIKTLLVKRVDSSFHAFKQTLRRYHQANTAMMRMLKSDRIFIAPQLDVNEFVLSEREDALEELLKQAETSDQIQVYQREDFDEVFRKGIERDQVILDDLVKAWDAVDHDPKYEEFVRRLKGELFSKSINDNHKLVIFSESKETTQYVVGRLKQDGFTRVLAVDSDNRKESEGVVRANFDANLSAFEQDDDLDIIFTTEVLAEGVNLHRANVIMNYDTPWNATRLMQRIGRVNRIGTTSDRIHIYNFFPTERTDNEIELNKKAYMKLQAFHSALGEDSQIYSQDETYGTFGLFERVPEEERDERLHYLNQLRSFRDESPDEYLRIRNTVPLRARVGRKVPLTSNSTIAFIKDRKRDAFYFINEDLTLDEKTFVEAAQIFECHATEKAKPLHAQHHAQIEAAIGSFHTEQQVAALGERASSKLGPNEQKALHFVNQNAWQEYATGEDRLLMDNAKVAIRTGRFQKLPREINKLLRTNKLEKMDRHTTYKKLMAVLRSYPLLDLNEDGEEAPRAGADKHKVERSGHVKAMPQVIISESFV
jgi:superfamily II DNA or RNA helicase